MSGGAQVFILLVFATVALLMQGLVVPVFGENAKARKRLKKRIEEIESASAEESLSSLLREKYLRRLSPLERRLESLPAMEAVATRIEQAGHKILAYRLVLLSLAIGATVLVVSWAYFRAPLIAIVTALLATYSPFMKISIDRVRRMHAFEEQLPDAIDTMKRALKAGHPLGATLKLVADEMDDPVAGEFELTFGEINYGNDVRRAMLGLLSRVPSVTVMALVTSILVQKETGGNLSEILEKISAVIRGRFRFQRKVQTYSAEGRMSAWILAMVPLTLFAGLWLTQPDYLPVLLEDRRGQKMVVYGIVSGVVGIFWIRKILRIEV
ncbi:MAG: type II secretion system F family protein [Gammaproteobacteria bacterium]|nr:type II secretion system F family protein [Gammaproteobacteria bacterium]MDH3416127.1 type II secretion system F family protein [Gammaproteobacteria bacterium]